VETKLRAYADDRDHPGRTDGYPEPIIDLVAEAAVARKRFRAATM
jgi:hypothetical protein